MRIYRFTEQVQREAVRVRRGFVAVTTWACGTVTRSQRMPLDEATEHAKNMRKVCTVVSAAVEPQPLRMAGKRKMEDV